MSTELTSVPVNRSTLWHGQWNRCGRFYLAECHALRRLDHDWIDRVIATRRAWGQRPIMNYGGSWRHGWEPVRITEEDVIALHAMCDFLIADATPRKIMIQDNHIYVYANDAAIYQRITDHGLAQLTELSEVNLTGVPGTVHLRHSDHSLRSYFRGRKLGAATAQSVRRWLLAQESVRLSPSLGYWCENDGRWLYTYYFLDHDTPSTVDMLQIIAPGIVRCTMPIVTDK
jgi:elongation factor P hydroxylase